jgi:hypothetical protein
MGFFVPVPFTSAKAFYSSGFVGDPSGAFWIQVEGTPDGATGIQLRRDLNFVGGLKIDVMGLLLPVGPTHLPPPAPYKVSLALAGLYLPEIVIGEDALIPVTRIADDELDAFLDSLSPAALAPAAA